MAQDCAAQGNTWQAMCSQQTLKHQNMTNLGMSELCHRTKK